MKTIKTHCNDCKATGHRNNISCWLCGSCNVDVIVLSGNSPLGYWPQTLETPRKKLRLINYK